MDTTADPVKGKGRKLQKILKSLSRCRTFSSSRRASSPPTPFMKMPKSKSWPREAEADQRPRKPQVAPEGCFTVYVGTEKERFVIKTEYANHPLFKMLLEDAEMEYGFNSEGPLALPCEVELFHKVLSEMNNDEIHPRCSFVKSYSAYGLLTPSRV